MYLITDFVLITRDIIPSRQRIGYDIPFSSILIICYGFLFVTAILYAAIHYLFPAISKNNTAGIKSLEEKLDILSTYGGSYVSLREKLQHEINQLSIVKSKYEQAKIDAEQSLTSKFIVNRAFKAEKKSYPIRWLIVTVSIVSSLILALLAILLIENIKEVKLSKN
jgi:hypothetical protein